MSKSFSSEALEIITDIDSNERYLRMETQRLKDYAEKIVAVQSDLDYWKENHASKAKEVEAYENALAELRVKLIAVLGVEIVQPTLPLGKCHVDDGSVASLEKRSDAQS